MLTKATAKFIKSLQLKKYRKQEQLFVVEGTKSVQEVLKSQFKVKIVVATQDFISKHKINDSIELITVSRKELSGLGSFKTNDGAIAVVQQQENSLPQIGNELVLVMDDINDPGNFGTIIRIADWYGIKQIIASSDTVEIYNPKVIAASKGSFVRVSVYYTDLTDFFESQKLPVYGACMDGKNIHQLDEYLNGFIVMGNEANGISEGVMKHINQKITIPKFGEAESLNVAMATAIICDNFSRNLKN